MFRRAFSLIELLIVVALLGLVASLVMPQFQPAVTEQLQSTAQIVRSELTYARSLAVTNNSSYRLTFDPAGNRYTLQHSGAAPWLANLPPSPFHRAGDATGQVTRLDELPTVGPRVRLAAVRRLSTPPVATDQIEFLSLGETASASPTEVWLESGSGGGRLYLPVTVDPVTGLATLGAITATAP